MSDTILRRVDKNRLVLPPMNELLSISPIDGRYHSKTAALAEYFSEYSLIRARIEVEVEYLILLSTLKLTAFDKFSPKDMAALRSIYQSFELSDAERVKELEKTTNHDVKAVEYFLKEKVLAFGIVCNTEYIHFGLTSQDINNTAFPLLLRRYMTDMYIPHVRQLRDQIKEQAIAWRDIPLLAKTHGQPASPTSLGKEMYVYVERISNQIFILEEAIHYGKFGGATGNFNAHRAAYPDHNWPQIAEDFLKLFGLTRQLYTTQIEHYDGLAHILDTTKRLQTILIDYSRDMWSYISFEIFGQKINEKETGSSAMPHKVNPIDFENAEGNCMYANAILEFLSSKLPVSRLQRDLTDSTVLRNIGVPYAHAEVALASLQRGMNKLILNADKINAELEANWSVIAEGIQTILRREGFEQPYELLKSFSRKNHKPSGEDFASFIHELKVSDEVKQELKKLSPQTYIGFAAEF